MTLLDGLAGGTMLRALGIGLCLLTVTEAHAFAAESIQVAPHAPTRSWYGWQTLTIDAGNLAFAGVVAATVRGEPGLAVLWLVPPALGHVFGAPVVHWAHDNGGTGWASLGMRVGGPLLAGLIVRSAAEPSEGCGAACWTAISVGYLVPVALDAAVFSWEKPASPAPRPSVAPTASMKKDGLVLGMQGTF
jgi:hypothetical protein